MRLDALTSCSELTSDHAELAVASCESFRAFLAWSASVARPADGAPKVLMAIALLTRAEWLEGRPTGELRGDDASTTISLFADLGLGIRERIAPAAHLPVPLSEFERAVELAPELLGPFCVMHDDGALLLSPIDAPEESSPTAPRGIRIADQCLSDLERATVGTLEPTPPSEPPTVRDPSGPHTHPTVRRMGAVRPEVLRRGQDLPPDEDD